MSKKVSFDLIPIIFYEPYRDNTNYLLIDSFRFRNRIRKFEKLFIKVRMSEQYYLDIDSILLAINSKRERNFIYDNGLIFKTSTTGHLYAITPSNHVYHIRYPDR